MKHILIMGIPMPAKCDTLELRVNDCLYVLCDYPWDLHGKQFDSIYTTNEKFEMLDYTEKMNLFFRLSPASLEQSCKEERNE